MMLEVRISGPHICASGLQEASNYHRKGGNQQLETVDSKEREIRYERSPGFCVQPKGPECIVQIGGNFRH